MGRNEGTVVRWNAERNFGFIEDASDKSQHFVHFSALKMEGDAFRAVSVGQEVEFDVTDNDGRTRAENVTARGGAPLPAVPRGSEGAGGYGGGRGGGGYRGGRDSRDGGHGYQSGGFRGGRGRDFGGNDYRGGRGHGFRGRGGDGDYKRPRDNNHYE